MATIVFAASQLPSLYESGDAITVVPDDHQFSARELTPPDEGGSFWRVTITDVTVEQARSFIGALYEPAQPGDPELDADPEDQKIYRGKSRSYADPSQISQALVDQLNATGEATGTRQEFRKAVRAKKWDRQSDSTVDDGTIL